MHSVSVRSSYVSSDGTSATFQKKIFSSAPAPFAVSLQVAKRQSSCSMYLVFSTSPTALYSLSGDKIHVSFCFDDLMVSYAKAW